MRQDHARQIVTTFPQTEEYAEVGVEIEDGRILLHHCPDEAFHHLRRISAALQERIVTLVRVGIDAVFVRVEPQNAPPVCDGAFVARQSARSIGPCAPRSTAPARCPPVSDPAEASLSAIHSSRRRVPDAQPVPSQSRYVSGP